MKKLRKTMAAFLALTMLTASGAAAGVSAVNAAENKTAVDDCNDDWLHAVGSRLYDKDGNEVWITGANWFGFNCGENLPHGLYAADCDAFLSNVADRGINLIRFPVSTELLLSWMNGTPNAVSSINAGYNPPQDIVGEDGTVTPAGAYVNINKDFVLEDGKTVKNSMEIFDIMMEKCKEYGIKVMIDIHSPAAHNSGHNYNLWYYDASCPDAGNMAVTADGVQVTTEMWMDTIVWLADKYKNDDTILAYDLKNEPHGKGQDGSVAAKWDDSTDENNWAYAATECANAILAVNPNALILIEGVEQYCKDGISSEAGVEYYWGMPDSRTDSPYHPAWWGGNLRGVRDYPITPDSGTSQIVYSPHDYGPAVYAQTWFDKEFTTQTLLDDYWYDTWAYINEEDIAPLLIGEWGGLLDGGKNEKWMTLLRDYMIENHINHTFWCLNPNSGDTEGLLEYDFLSWDEVKYEIFEQAIWQTQETGKFIGLDHQKALGINDTGISVSEFYESYAYTEGSNIDGGTILTGDETKPTQEVIIPSDTTEPETETTTEEVTATTAPTTATTEASDFIYGDANLSGNVEISDAVKIMSNVTDKVKYPLTDQEINAADVYQRGDGISNMDALAVQKKLAQLLTDLPESHLE
ncbi:MAG: cellulase family glycosylhydrolase [Ruminococcus sp.]|nr:cellulase family glycosylhydrolase [Ruminococcus sp.]